MYQYATNYSPFLHVHWSLICVSCVEARAYSSWCRSVKVCDLARNQPKPPWREFLVSWGREGVPPARCKGNHVHDTRLESSLIFRARNQFRILPVGKLPVPEKSSEPAAGRVIAVPPPPISDAPLLPTCCNPPYACRSRLNPSPPCYRIGSEFYHFGPVPYQTAN